MAVTGAGRTTALVEAMGAATEAATACCAGLMTALVGGGHVAAMANDGLMMVLLEAMGQ